MLLAKKMLMRRLLDQVRVLAKLNICFFSLFSQYKRHVYLCTIIFLQSREVLACTACTPTTW
jgi:hypothetical protein